MPKQPGFRWHQRRARFKLHRGQGCSFHGGPQQRPPWLLSAQDGPSRDQTQELRLGHFGCFRFLPIMNKVLINICVQVFVGMYVFISFRYIPRSGLAGQNGSCMLHFIRIGRTVFQGGCHSAFLAAPVRAPDAPYPCWHLGLSFCCCFSHSNRHVEMLYILKAFGLHF